MKKLVEVPLEDGNTIVVEVDEPEVAKGFRKAANKDEVPGTAAETLEKSLMSIRPALLRMRQTLNELNNPSDIEVQFGIKVIGGVGAVFASASTEGNFTIKLAWKNEKPPVPAPADGKPD